MQASRRISRTSRRTGREVALVFSDIEPLISQKPLQARLPHIGWPRDPFEVAVDCGVLLNRELLELCQRNVNASFGLLRRLSAASTLGEVGSVQADHLNNQLTALTCQGDEFLTLSAHIMRRLIESAAGCWNKTPVSLELPR
jgi:hypothetical protein